MQFAKLLRFRTKPLILNPKVSRVKVHHDLDKIEEAVIAQNEAILLLETEIKHSATPITPVLTSYLNNYKQKKEYLTQLQKQKQLSPPSSDLLEEFQLFEQIKTDFMDAELKFEEHHNKEIGVKIPDDAKLRPFYFIRLLQESMIKGAFISSEVFIHKEVWD